jgi:hypothetical protein
MIVVLNSKWNKLLWLEKPNQWIHTIVLIALCLNEILWKIMAKLSNRADLEIRERIKLKDNDSIN